MVSFDITVKFKQNKQRFLFTAILNQTQSQLNFVNILNLLVDRRSNVPISTIFC